MLVDEVIARIKAECASLPEGRVEGAAEFTALVREGAMPAAPVFAFVVPVGLVPRGDGEASAGAFVQHVDEAISVILVIQAAGDATGRSALPKIETIIGELNAALPGWKPAGASGVFRLRRGQMLALDDHGAQYRLDYAIQTQIRNIA